MTITIYQTHYEFYGTTYVLRFSFSGHPFQKMDDWISKRDKIVFDEQVETGSFRGKFEVDDETHELLKLLKRDGKISPYYGASGGGRYYFLQVALPKAHISIEHTGVEETATFETEAKVIRATAETVKRHHKRGFMIAETSYETLSQWKHWDVRDEFTARYRYKFGPTTIGTSVIVEDMQTEGEQIDISDYSNW